jgi:hypothetical protein
MAYFADLSEYTFLKLPHQEVRQTNIGWLAAGREFRRRKAAEPLLSLVWDYCMLPFQQTRGFSSCQLCPPGGRMSSMPLEHPVSERNEHLLILGSAEIRVLSRSGEIFAAPNMIYHYMAIHDYDPPEPFIDALVTGPRVSSQEYMQRLAAAGLEPGPRVRSFPRPARPPLEAGHRGSVVPFRKPPRHRA